MSQKESPPLNALPPLKRKMTGLFEKEVANPEIESLLIKVVFKKKTENLALNEKMADDFLKKHLLLKVDYLGPANLECVLISLLPMLEFALDEKLTSTFLQG